MNTNTAQILAWITGRLAGWLTPIIATGVSWLIAQAVAYAPFLAEPLSTVDQVAITATLVAILMAGINAFTNRYLTAGVAQLQSIINKVLPVVQPGARPLEQDGVPGPRTVGKAAAVASEILKQ